MNNQELFMLYKRIQNKDKNAEEILIKLHKKHYPRNSLNQVNKKTDSDYRIHLHTMYLHLTRKIK